MATTPDENSWLFHELGRCHLELGNYDQAKAHGEKSLTAAQESSDLAWQLNACVLVAQAEGEAPILTHISTTENMLLFEIGNCATVPLDSMDPKPLFSGGVLRI